MARTISKILLILGLYKFLAYLKYIGSYGCSFGHSDPDPSSVFSILTSQSSCTLPINNLPCDRPKESPTQQQQQISRLLNRRKSLDPVRFREIKRELFGSEEFSLKLDDDQPPPPPPGFPIDQY